MPNLEVIELYKRELWIEGLDGFIENRFDLREFHLQEQKGFIEEESCFKSPDTYKPNSIMIKHISPNEVYFYMLNEKKNDDVKITDVYVPHQRVDPSFCKTLLGSGLLADEKRIYEEGKKLSAWGHSHGNHNVFHSPIDAENFENVPGLEIEANTIRVI